MSIITGANLRMKNFVIFLALITIFMISTNPVYAICAYDPTQPHKPCEDSSGTLIIETSHAQIENIEEVLYYVSESFMPESSTEMVSFHDVVFTIPYTKTPPRYIYSDVIFSDGTKETLRVVLDEYDLSDHLNPQAGLTEKNNGYSFLVSVDLRELSPLKQQKNGVPPNEIECKDGMYLGFSESNGKAICATGYTLDKLIAREWAKSHTSISSNTVSRPNDIVVEYCPEGTQLIQGGWFSKSERNPPVQVVNVKEVYDPEYDSQGIEITFNPTFNPETYGKALIFAFVDCDLSFDYFEVLILPNTIEERKNFVVHYPSFATATMYFDNQDDIRYQIDGVSDDDKNSFTIWLDAEDDWFIDEPLNTYLGAKYIQLSASNPDTGDLYDWMNYRLHFTQEIAESEPEPERTTEDEKNLRDARQKLREVYHLNSSFGPFNIKDVIVGYGIGDGVLVVDVLTEYYESEHFDLIKQKIREVAGPKVNIEFSPSGAIVPTNIETIFSYVWNSFLNKQGIEFTPKEQSYANTDVGYDPDLEYRVCSPIIAENGTEFYISSTFIKEPFEITRTFIDKKWPDDCYKVWKTDTILVEPDRVLMLWLENYHSGNE